MMTTIPVQFNEMELKKIDYLVQIGRYKNRNQAIKGMIHDKLSEQVLDFDFENLEEEEKRKKILEKIIAKNIPISFTISSNKTSVELIGEDRER
jgi:hypothetical protein